VCSKLIHEVAKFFGVADLNDRGRRRFLDKWLTRAEKIHDDDLLLNKCRKGSSPTTTTYQPSRASRDVTDSRCV